MSEASEHQAPGPGPDDPAGTLQKAPGPAQEGAVVEPAPAAQGRTGRLHIFRRREHKAAADGARRTTRGGGRTPEGLAASLVTSGSLLMAMVEDVRMREANQPEDLRLLADTFARHNAAKEATVLKVLERHGAARDIIKYDRQEGTLLQGILDRALMGRHPADTHTLTVDGALAQMYQFLYHERRELVPAIERSVPRDESETLAAAFEAIDDV